MTSDLLSNILLFNIKFSIVSMCSYREGRPDSDDDDGSESEKDYGDSDSNTSSSAANDSDGEHD